MKVIATNLTTDVSATNANANYPASNLLDEHPKKIWKSTGYTADLVFTIQGGISNAFILFNTNALTASFGLSDPNNVAWEAGVDWEDGVEWDNNTLTLTETTALDGVNGAVMVEWDNVNAAVELTVSLSASTSVTLFAGVGVSGNLLEYAGPKYGFSESGIDYSIKTELSNGALYIKDRDLVRSFDITSQMPLSQYNTFLGTVWKTLGSNPTGWVITNESDSRWLIYGRFDKPPKGKHVYSNLTEVSFNVTEVL